MKNVWSPKATTALPGDRYGRLTVIEEMPKGVFPSGQKYRLVKCECECGRIKVHRAHALQNGNSNSCGCLSAELARKRHKTHGCPPEFRIWQNMKSRCFNPNEPNYERYGKRGITMCPEWKRSFMAFYRDMGQRPSKMHSVDRIDNDGPYSKENCRWATPKEQKRNRRDNKMITFRGKTQCLAAWAEEVWINRKALGLRLRYGWTTERALTTPLHSAS